MEILKALPGVNVCRGNSPGALVNWAKDQEARVAAMARWGKLERLKNRSWISLVPGRWHSLVFIVFTISDIVSALLISLLLERRG